MSSSGRGQTAMPLPQAAPRMTRSIADLWSGWRDRLLASPRFQRWAAAFPLTRPIARSRARTLFDLCAGFVYSQILLACVQLRLFEMLAQGPQTLAVLAERMQLAPDAAERLLRAAAALRLVEARGDAVFGLGDLGAALVGNPGIAAMVRHHAALYRDLADPVALLRASQAGTELGRYWPYAGAESPASASAEEVADYSALMSASQGFVADEILDAYPVGRHRCLMDVGGGEGTFLRAAAARAPNLELMLFDLPAVCARADARLAAAGLASRARTQGGDFLRDRLPSGADLVTLVRVIHDHGDEAVLRLLRAIHAALPPGGVLLIAEPMSEAPGAERVGDAYFTFYLMAMGSGRPRAPAAIEGLLRGAGFDSVRLLRTRMPLLTQVIQATRGANTAALV
jgi:demethylspheroidene O-methyltransferase